MEHLLWIFGSVVAVSLVAFIGVVTLSFRESFLHRLVFVLVSFAAGGLFGGAFIHLLPRTAQQFGFSTLTGVYVLGGIASFFTIDKYIHWHHHHFREEEECEECAEPLSYMILLGDGFHNLIDGMVIAAAYLSSLSVGIATTLAVVLHEIPQEIGDFGVLVHGGLSVRRALIYNFLSALTAVLGAVVVVLLATGTGITRILVPFAAGGFIYIAGTDLLPEFKEETDVQKSTIQMVTFLLGIGVMWGLKLVVQTYL
ncbi:MAG: ZIP family metal transporter [Candidatus Nanohaloarchaeota archaeon QJJ-7]|nr:ZIP family metal transporter [Candidatus Nanohaloarchaeota archaeon QJJ-7]